MRQVQFNFHEILRTTRAALILGLLYVGFFMGETLATPAQEIRDEVYQILSTGNATDRPWNDAMTTRMRAILAQGEPDRGVAINQLLDIVRRIPAPGLGAANNRQLNEGYAAVKLLNAVNFPWPAELGTQFHIWLLQHFPTHQELLGPLIRLSNSHPQIIPDITRAFNTRPLLVQGENLLRAINNWASFENVSRHWERPLMQMEKATRRVSFFDPLFSGFANSVPWVRRIACREIRSRPNSDVYLELMQRTDGRPLHPDIEEAAAADNDPDPIFLLLESRLSPAMESRFVEALRASNKEMRSAIRKAFGPSNGNQRREILHSLSPRIKTQVANVLFPRLRELSQNDFVVKTTEAMGEIGEPNAAIRDYYAEALADPDRSGHTELEILAGLEKNYSREYRTGRGLALPEVQQAILGRVSDLTHTHSENARNLLKILAQDFPAESYSRPLIEHSLAQLPNNNGFDLNSIHLPLLRRAAARYPWVRRQLTEQLDVSNPAVTRSHAANILSEYYNSIPEVREVLNTGSITTIPMYETWVREHGMPEGEFARRLQTHTFRGNDPVHVESLLSNPGYKMQIPGQGEAPLDPSIVDNLRINGSLPIAARDDGDLILLFGGNPTELLEARPGLPALAALFENPKGPNDLVSSPFIRRFLTRYSISGWQRALDTRIGHRLRNETLETAATNHFKGQLDPLSTINNGYLRLRNEHQREAQNRSAPNEGRIPLNVKNQLETQARNHFLSSLQVRHPQMSPTQVQTLSQMPQFRSQLLNMIAHEEMVYLQRHPDLTPPYEERLRLWRARQSEALRESLRTNLTHIVRTGDGNIVLQNLSNLPALPGFEPNTDISGEPGHEFLLGQLPELTRHLSQIDITWNPVTREPALLIAGQTIPISHLQYVPSLPPEIHPDAVSTFMMTSPDTLVGQSRRADFPTLVRETLFRRSLPLMLQYYGEAARILSPEFTDASDLEFQLAHMQRERMHTTPLRWLPPSTQLDENIAVEAFLWRQTVEGHRDFPNAMLYWQAREEHARTTGEPVHNLAVGMSVESFRNAQAQANATPLHGNSNTRATNSVPTTEVMHRVEYQGRIPREELPTHFTLGEKEDFLNPAEAQVMEIREPRNAELMGQLARAPNRIMVRSAEPWQGGENAPDALIARPEGWDISQIEVVDGSGRALRQGVDFAVVRHRPTGDYAVRPLNPTVTGFNVNATYQIPSVRPAVRPDAMDPLYDVARLRRINERFRAAGFEHAANHLEHALNTRATNGQIHGRIIEGVMQGSALYSYRPEYTFPPANRPRAVNEFTPWARFLAEDNIMCAQCDATNGLFTTMLESYHQDNPAIRMQTRTEFSVEAGAATLNANNLHARTHELHLTDPSARVVYDSTPYEHDPRSTRPNLDAANRSAASQRPTLRSRWSAWWQRIRNVVNQIRENRALARANRGLPAAQPVAPQLPPVVENVITQDHPVAPLAESIPPRPRTPFDLPAHTIAERQGTLNREITNTRNFITRLGGIKRLNRDDFILRAERLARTYRDFISGEASVSEAAQIVRRIHPDAVFSEVPEEAELNHAFAEAAQQILDRFNGTRPLPDMGQRFPHYHPSRVAAVTEVLTGVLTPLTGRAAVTEEACLTQSLGSVLSN